MTAGGPAGERRQSTLPLQTTVQHMPGATHVQGTADELTDPLTGATASSGPQLVRDQP